MADREKDKDTVPMHSKQREKMGEHFTERHQGKGGNAQAIIHVVGKKSGERQIAYEIKN